MGDVLAGVGLFAAVLAVAAAMLWEPSTRRSAAMLLALVLIPVLILGDQWNSTEIVDLRDHLARFVALGIVAVAVVGALTLLFRRRPLLLPLAVIAAVPFRIPLHAGGQDANLLIPLYLVIAGGVLATVWGELLKQRELSPAGGAAGEERDAASAGGAADEAPLRADRGVRSGGSSAVTGPAAVRMIPWTLSAVLVLYAIQSVYSDDFSRALQNVAFFYVPFALAFTLLSECRWDRPLLVRALGVVAAEALAFAAFGFWEYGARHLIWNSDVIQSNDFHTYFRVNSLFWDPNVYGRYLALTIVAIVGVVLWARSARLLAWLGVLIAILWLGLMTTFSQSSFVALLVGLAMLAALRWSLRWTLGIGVAGALVAVVFVIAAGGSLKIDFSTEQTLNKDTAGRANLVSEGIKLFSDRPLWGFGSGSFSVAYREHRSGTQGQLSVSHTEPVTVAAEQGIPGLIAYVALLIAAFVTLLVGMRGLMPGLRGPPDGDGPNASSAGGATDEAPLRADLGARSGGSSVVTGPAAERSEVSAVTGPAAERMVVAASRAAILACFAALLAHTMAYAGFLEDPLTWVLLAVGASLATPSLGAAGDDFRGSRAVPQSPASAPA